MKQEVRVRLPIAFDEGSAKSADSPGSRRARVAELVIKKGAVSVEELADDQGVSSMTIYRDVSWLEEAGMLQRHNGKVVAKASGLQEASARFRLDQSEAAKEQIGACAAAMVPSGSSIMLDDSTSGVWVVRALRDIASMSIVTNSLLVAEEAGRSGAENLIIVGGAYREWAESLVGAAAVDMIGQMHANFAMVSASGISDWSCFHPYEEIVAVKRAMLESAETRILLLDHTKFARKALYRFAKMAEFTTVVVDSETPKELVARMRDAGVGVTVAPRAGSARV